MSEGAGAHFHAWNLMHIWMPPQDASILSETTQHFLIEETTTVEDLVQTLRTIGVETETIIHIIKAIDKAGSLYGTLILM